MKPIRPLAPRHRWAFEYDKAFTEWLNQFEEGKEITDPQVLVFDRTAMTIQSMLAFRVAINVRESVEDEETI